MKIKFVAINLTLFLSYLSLANNPIKSGVDQIKEILIKDKLIKRRSEKIKELKREAQKEKN